MEYTPKDYEYHLKKAKESKCWPKEIEGKYGEQEALAFLFGLDNVIDGIKHDLEILESQPKGTHIGQLELSHARIHLPDRYLMRYDYEFLYYMLGTAQEIMRGEWSWKAECTIQDIIIRGAACEAYECFASYYEDEDLNGPEWGKWGKDMQLDECLDNLFYTPTGDQLVGESCWFFENWFIPAIEVEDRHTAK